MIWMETNGRGIQAAERPSASVTVFYREAAWERRRSQADTDGAGHRTGDGCGKNNVQGFLAAGDTDEETDEHVDDTRGEESGLYNGQDMSRGNLTKLGFGDCHHRRQVAEA